MSQNKLAGVLACLAAVPAFAVLVSAIAAIFAAALWVGWNAIAPAFHGPHLAFLAMWEVSAAGMFVWGLPGLLRAVGEELRKPE